jgi:vancomycin resistance protein YoaR
MRKVSGLVIAALISILCFGCSSGGAKTLPPATAASVSPAETGSAPAPSAAPAATPLPQPTETVPPEPEKAEMPEGMAVLGECALSTAGLPADSLKNIMYACMQLDGLRLLPGQSLSLAAATKRAGKSGYQVFPNDPAIQTYSPPGMTRVAGALYNAALLADLTVVERHAFSTPAAYLPAGLEAAFNNDASTGLALIDLAIRNGKDSPVWLQAAYEGTTAKTLTVRILGSPWEGERPISLQSTVVETIPPPEETAIRTSQHAEPGKPYEVAAREGQRVRVERVWQDAATGITRAEFLYEDYYPPFPRTFVCFPGEEPGD